MNTSITSFVGPPNQPDRYELVSVIDNSGTEGSVWRGYTTFGEPRLEVALEIYRPERVSLRGLEQDFTSLVEMVHRMRSVQHTGLAPISQPIPRRTPARQRQS